MEKKVRPSNYMECTITGYRLSDEHPVFTVVANMFDMTAWVDLLRNMSQKKIDIDYFCVELYKQPKLFESNEVF